LAFLFLSPLEQVYRPRKNDITIPNNPMTPIPMITNPMGTLAGLAEAGSGWNVG
jgi:hypothetical protein